MHHAGQRERRTRVAWQSEVLRAIYDRCLVLIHKYSVRLARQRGQGNL